MATRLDSGPASGARKIPYDRGWSWVVVLGICMMHVFLVGYFKTFGLLFVELQDLFNLTSQQTAWVSTAMLLAVDILSPLGTALGDIFGSRVVVMVGGFLVSLSLVLSSLLYNIQYMILVMGVMFGVGATLCYAPSMIMVGYYFKRRLGLANALAVTGSSLGQFLLPPIVNALLVEYSLSGTLLILAGIMFNLTLSGALLRPVSFYDHDDCLSEETSIGTSSATSGATADERLVNYEEPTANADNDFNDDDSNGKISFRPLDHNRLTLPNEITRKERFRATLLYASSSDLHCSMNVRTSQIIVKEFRQRSTCTSFLRNIFDISLLKNPVYSVFALGCMLINFSYIGTFRYLPAHCKDLGFEERDSALLLSVVGLTDLVSRLLIGVVADTTFVRERVRRCRLLAFSLIALGGNGLFLVYCETFWQITCSCVLYGVFGGLYMTLMSVSLVDLLGAKHLSRAWGIMLLLYSVTTIGEPLVLGNLRDLTGSYHASFLTCAGLFLGGGLLVFIAPAAKHCL